ncbi:hypothetical protein B296_00041020 [Ensete ventricosum]|uniref:Uncharacterized protein n=1 Tax=Ensete ventricosum TaxID=4639 RepID=A0A426XC29_ENSVE|nr:hypothetical protein B296_00041020 [Ensete ventricosum]
MGDSGLTGYNFSDHLLFFSLPLRKSYKIRLEEFRYRDLSCGYRLRGGRLTSFLFSIRIWNTGIYDLPCKNSEEVGLVVAGYKGQPAAAKAPCKKAAGHGHPPMHG